MSAEDAVSFGLSGPTLRGSGVNYDLRKAEPYSAYPKCEFSVPLGKNGDTYDRYWIRVMELYESVKIIKQCLEQMQDGPIMADVPSVTLPPKERVFTNLESMIQQFKLFSQGFNAPPGKSIAGPRRTKGSSGSISSARAAESRTDSRYAPLRLSIWVRLIRCRGAT